MTLYSEFCKNQGCCKGSLMENTTNYVLFPTKNRYNLKQNPLSVACHKVGHLRQKEARWNIEKYIYHRLSRLNGECCALQKSIVCESARRTKHTRELIRKVYIVIKMGCRQKNYENNAIVYHLVCASFRIQVFFCMCVIMWAHLTETRS